MDDFKIEHRNGHALNRLGANATLALLSDLLERSRLAAFTGKSHGGDRDYYKVLGYPRVLTFQDYDDLYDRGDIAGVIVDLPAEYTWRYDPELRPKAKATPALDPAPVDDDPEGGDEPVPPRRAAFSQEEEEEEVTADHPFFKEWERFVKRLKVYHYMQRVDRIAGIGEFGILLIGTKGGDSLDQPLTKLNSLDDVIYLQVYSQRSVQIAEFEMNVADPRYSLPKIYRISPSEMELAEGKKQQPVAFNVHWSRVIHVAENLKEDEVYGRPRLQRPFNLLLDMLKSVGGASEMFWLNVGGIDHINIPPEFEVDDDDLKELETKIFEAYHGLRRLVQTQGAEWNKIGAGTPDVEGIVGPIQDLIAATTRIPKRILFGNEAGELASSTDQSEWNGVIVSRQKQQAEPVILRGFISRLTDLGAVAPPEFDVYWPPLIVESPKDQAEVAAKKAAAIASYSAGAPELVVPPEEFRERILGLEPQIPTSPASRRLAREAEEARQAEIEEQEALADRQTEREIEVERERARARPRPPVR